MAAVPPFRPGQPILAKDLNNLAGQANAGAAWNPDEAAFEGGRSGRANNATPPYRAIATFEISSGFVKSADLDDNPDDVESCEAKVLRFLSQSNTYEGSDLERKERLYRVAAGADLVVGDHATAWLNQQSGRWEIVCGGPAGGSSSGSSEVCRMGLAGIPWHTIPGYEAGKYQFPLKTPDDCLMLVTPKTCETSGGSSSSSSSVGSSSSEDEGCENCDGPAGGITITIDSGVFWHYGGGPEGIDLAYGSPTPFDVTFSEGCTGTATFPKSEGPGNQTWQVNKISPAVFQVICLNTEGGPVGIWEMTVAEGNCCPSGSAALTEYSFPTPNDPIFLSSSGGPC